VVIEVVWHGVESYWRVDEEGSKCTSGDRSAEAGS